ncbi:MAG: hypothetical protein ACD_7C00126G0006 [uncultured bacterium]|nr:MAG: hypothetical protein ACD_7C00126G0006 [uncultured bacterium]KKP68478.1 MAG: hypothetical protein UR66_C0005G0025 [Candidatus Moranbacteria bacterium GW2011_GWE1_35_17]KKP84024.1 MAG: hypothetical protein UR82_C0014G0003 [Candidatus Moranbacteria bacterium GW2011_GWF1_35_5]
MLTLLTSTFKKCGEIKLDFKKYKEEEGLKDGKIFKQN